MGAAACYDNRELSWLKFNERVLEEAEDTANPLCERMSFLSIFQRNLDEFFMVRVGFLDDQKLMNPSFKENKTGMTAREQLEAVLEEVKILNKRKSDAFNDIMKALSSYGITLVNFRELSDVETKYLKLYFKKEIVPIISPMIVGKRQPFPFLKNKEIYAAVLLETKNGKERLGIIPCSTDVLERLVAIPFKEEKHILSEELILHFVPEIFDGYRVKSKALIRITRNADIEETDVYNEGLDYREQMENLVKKRKKLNSVRMELSGKLDESAVSKLAEYLGLSLKRVFICNTPLEFSFFSIFQDKLRQNTELFYEKRVPQGSVCFDEAEDIIEQIKEEDKLLSYPYESMKPFLKLLSEASKDKEVVSIKITLYRVARQSKVVEALIEAAENGKEVFVMVELRARFDEQNNIEWSRHLEEAGCHVVYGLEGLKVHSKLCLITRKTSEGIEYITQIGTGNYNEKTARLYTDLMLFTASQRIGTEAANLFNKLYKGEIVEHSEELLIAPKCLMNKVLYMIEKEIEYANKGEEAYIGLKLNSLTDINIINRLIEASRAGVRIEMIVRGICCLVSGVKGYTDNIHLISIVGRFLEHSRMYIFGTDGREQIYIASSDFMTRNMVRRVEVAVPVFNIMIRKRLKRMFDIMLNDNCKARIQQNDGTYRRVSNDKTKLNAQEYFYQEAYTNALTYNTNPDNKT